jgi:hypothetical protein
MTTQKTNRMIVLSTIVSLFIAIMLPSVAFADHNRGRGRGQERRYERRDDRRDYNGYDRNRRDKRKQDKFINGHDARDGRWDGRGPNRHHSYYQDDRYDRRDRRCRGRHRRGRARGILGAILGNY